MGGARTSIEATAAGVPLLSRLPGFSTRFGATHVKPASWPLWRTLGDLVDLLEQIDPDWIAEQGRLGREFYQQHHHPDRLRMALADLDAAILPPKQDLPLAELIDVARVDWSLVGDWSYLRGEFAEGVLDG